VSAVSLWIQEGKEVCQRCHLRYKKGMRRCVSSVTLDIRGKRGVSAVSLEI
jgi:hypothetical protein